MAKDFSYWEYDMYSLPWDVCIVGSGINGLSTGISLLEKNPLLKILIIDRWFIPLGASTRNAGFSCFGSPSEILDDIRIMGEDEAISLVSKRWAGLQKLKSRLSDQAEYETFGGYELYHEDEFNDVNGNLAYLNSLLHETIGLKKVYQEAEPPKGIRNFSRAVYNPYEGQLHPGKMIEQLKKLYLDLGGKIWTGINVEYLEEDSEFVSLGNDLAPPVKAKKAVLTTNAFAGELVKGLDMLPARNHVIVTEPIKDLSWKGCFHYDKGFFYFRNVGNRILLGGARNYDLNNEFTGEFGSNDKLVNILKGFLYDHLAGQDCVVDYQWSGIIAVGSNKTPIIKALSPRVFIGVKCSGMGIALASLTGEELAELVLQQTN